MKLTLLALCFTVLKSLFFFKDLRKDKISDEKKKDIKRIQTEIKKYTKSGNITDLYKSVQEYENILKNK